MNRKSFDGVAWAWLVSIHRWLGIGIGLIVLLWCLSGVVMMYHQYPELDRREQIAGLDALNLDGCCETPDAGIGAVPVSSYRVEMLLGKPVLRYRARGSDGILDLESGRLQSTWTGGQLSAVGRAYAERQSWAAPNVSEEIVRDQWTVQGQFNTHRPMLKFENGDGFNWYVSGASAEIVQVTGRAERFWNWLGSIPHWLYPTELRRHPAAWAQVVIWLSVIGLFLTVTGITIGIARYRPGPGDRNSPFKGWWLWHHYAGLVFGIFTLTWLFSGLLSMNPWGVLESRSFAEERDRVNGVDTPLVDVVSSLSRVGDRLPANTVRIESATWLGQPYWLAYDRGGEGIRLSPSGRADPLSTDDGVDLAAGLGLDDARVDWLTEGDAYYYAHHNGIELPAIRVTDASGERYYIGASTGRLHKVADQSDRWQRWLFRGLHRGDFNAMFRSRPAWDLLLLLLLAGCTVGAATGTWIGVRRLFRPLTNRSR